MNVGKVYNNIAISVIYITDPISSFFSMKINIGENIK